MSAFIVSLKQINIICNWIHANQQTHLLFWERHTVEDLERIGRLFLAENYKSVNERYDENDIEDLYVFRPIHVHHIGAIQFIKLLNCLEYQSCEHDGWKDSEAYKILCEWRLAAIRCIPGYEEAEWSID